MHYIMTKYVHRYKSPVVPNCLSLSLLTMISSSFGPAALPATFFAWVRRAASLNTPSNAVLVVDCSIKHSAEDAF